MKRDRSGAILAGLIASLAMGCATPAKPVRAPLEVAPVTTLRSAELRDDEAAPRVGKPQRSAAPHVRERAQGKDAVPPRRMGGGFSGYK